MSKSKKTLSPLSVGPQTEEIFPGVRVTRRLALQNSAAALLLMALGINGCESGEENADQDDEDNDSEETADTKDKKSKKKSKSKSKKKGEKNEDEDESEPDEDEDEDESEPDEDEEQGDPKGDEKSEGNSDKNKEENEEKDQDEDEDKQEPEENETEEEEPEEDDDGPLSLEEILDRIVDDAKKLVADKSLDEEKYQAKVNRLLARLDEKTKIPRLNPGQVHNMRRIAGRKPYIHIFVMEMAPNAKIPLHDHPNRIGNILGWRGSAKTINYTPIKEKGGARKDGSFLLQETDRRDITKGKTGYLSRVAHNMHIVTAGPQGATMLDMFTYYDDSKANVPGQGSRFVRLGQVVDREKRIYRASYSRELAHLSAHDF